ncbi:MAG TPA: hypothetical protein VGK73_08680 [Polyangiaceae bacterium]
MSRDGEVTGPMDAAEVRRGIDQGRVTRGFMLRDDAGSEWVPIERSPFAGPLGPQSPKSHMGGAMLGIIAALAITAAIVFFATEGPPDDRSLDPVADTGPVSASSLAAESPAPEVAIGDRMGRAASLSEAINILRPHMGDAMGEAPHPSAAVLAMWMNHRRFWPSLQRMSDSSRAEAMKDSAAHRGLRICTTGSVVEIYADRSVDPPVYLGGMMTQSYDMVRFIAVKSTNGITEGAPGRLCGIIVGTQTYPNAAGGTSHALFVVGSFDLPENH